MILACAIFFFSGLFGGIALSYFYGHRAVNAAHAELLSAQAAATRLANKL